MHSNEVIGDESSTSYQARSEYLNERMCHSTRVAKTLTVNIVPGEKLRQSERTRRGPYQNVNDRAKKKQMCPAA